MSVLLTACASSPENLTPKDRVAATPDKVQKKPVTTASVTTGAVTTAAASTNPVPPYPHFEFRSTCGKPCQPIIVRWQYDGAYTLQRGDAPVETGQLSAGKVERLAALYGELQTMTLGWPRDLTRATLCTSFATDHAQKVFATPATVNGWTFKDNYGCTGFAEENTLRELEAKIEAILPIDSTH